jgi:hypothetical protein
MTRKQLFEECWAKGFTYSQVPHWFRMFKLFPIPTRKEYEDECARLEEKMEKDANLPTP